jgi:hypothetical protein
MLPQRPDGQHHPPSFGNAESPSLPDSGDHWDADHLKRPRLTTKNDQAFTIIYRTYNIKQYQHPHAIGQDSLDTTDKSAIHMFMTGRCGFKGASPKTITATYSRLLL